MLMWPVFLLPAIVCLLVVGTTTTLVVRLALTAADDDGATTVCLLTRPLGDNVVRLQDECVVMHVSAAASLSEAVGRRRKLFSADVHRTLKHMVYSANEYGLEHPVSVDPTEWAKPPASYWVNMASTIPHNTMGLTWWNQTIDPHCAPKGPKSNLCPLFYEVIDENNTVIDIRNGSNASLQDVIIDKVYNYDANWEHDDMCADYIDDYNASTEEHRYRCNVHLFNDGDRFIDAQKVVLVGEDGEDGEDGQGGGTKIVALRSDGAELDEFNRCPADKAVRVLNPKHFSVIYMQLLVHLYLRYEKGLTDASSAPRVELAYQSRHLDTLKSAHHGDCVDPKRLRVAVGGSEAQRRDEAASGEFVGGEAGSG